MKEVSFTSLLEEEVPAMPVKRESLLAELQEVGRYMVENDLAWGNAGNISARTGEESCLISASGTYLGDLEEGDIVECSFSEDHSLLKKKPSKEVPMHRAIFEERLDVNAVLHASPFYSTLVACSNLDIPSNLFVETMYYLERIARVPYYHPGSMALGEAVRQQAKNANIILLENHGVLIYDTSIKEARMGLHTLEMACRMLITTSRDPVSLNFLSSKTEEHFLHHSGYKPRRKWNGL